MGIYLHLPVIQACPPSMESHMHTSLQSSCQHTRWYQASGHSRGTGGGPASALSPGLSQAIQKAAGEGHSLALVLFMQLPQVSILSALELHHRLVVSELLQRGRAHL